MATERKKLARQLRNARKQRSRLQRKAKNFSTDDLVELLTMRGVAQRAKVEALVAVAEGAPSAERTE